MFPGWTFITNTGWLSFARCASNWFHSILIAALQERFLKKSQHLESCYKVYLLVEQLILKNCFITARDLTDRVEYAFPPISPENQLFSFVVITVSIIMPHIRGISVWYVFVETETRPLFLLRRFGNHSKDQKSSSPLRGLPPLL